MKEAVSLTQALLQAGALSQAQLARAIGVSPATIRRLANGRTDFSVKIQARLAAALNGVGAA